MNEAAAQKSTLVNPGTKLAYATPETAPQVPGRRKFFSYSDLGVTAASQGRMRAQLTTGITGMTQPTGWHYHLCESQFVYALRGWVDLEFEDGTKVRVKAGDSIFIPGGLRHNETAASESPCLPIWGPSPASRLLECKPRTAPARGTPHLASGLKQLHFVEICVGARPALALALLVPAEQFPHPGPG